MIGADRRFGIYRESCAATPVGALPAPDRLDAIGKKYGIATLGPPMTQ